MSFIKSTETGLVYRGEGAPIHLRQAYFPSAVELPHGELAVSMDVGGNMDDPRMRSFLCRSANGGKSWSPPALIFDPGPESGPVSTLCRTSLDSKGALLALVTSIDRSSAVAALGNPETDGYPDTRFILLRSQDGGLAWSEPAAIQPPLDWNVYETCSPILDLGGERWLLPTSTFRNWKGACTMGMKAVAFMSKDGGRTWTDTAVVMDRWKDRIASWEQKQTLLSDGRLLATCWAYDYGKRKSLKNGYSFSRDRGGSYGPALESPLWGETCTPLGLDDNHILCVYRRTDTRGLWGHLARLEGDKWIPLADEPLWGTETYSYVRKSASMLEEMTTLQFGYPSVIKLSSGKVLVTFWCVEDAISSIRWIEVGF